MFEHLTAENTEDAKKKRRQIIILASAILANLTVNATKTVLCFSIHAQGDLVANQTVTATEFGPQRRKVGKVHISIIIGITHAFLFWR